MDWTAGGAQFHSPTFYAFLSNLYHNADKDDMIATVDHIHKRLIRYQLAFSDKLLMPNTCVPPIHTTALDTPDWWAAFKRTIMEIRADVGEHGLDSGHADRSDQAQEARFRSASTAARSGLTAAMRTAQLNFNVAVKN
eukprot:6182269-Pleurochrysis_carterae.AAC.1